MQRRYLGKTDISVSVLGFGCASVWSKPFFDEAKAIELVNSALSHGICFFDTSHSYALAEERIGKILKNSNIDRKNIVISTKCGTRHIDGKTVHDWSIEWLRESVEISLTRMGISYIDLLHLHGPKLENLTPELIAFLNELKKEGKVKAIGINTFDTQILEYICQNPMVDFVMLDYNILRRDREDLIKRLTESGIGVIAGAPLAESLYSNRIFKIREKKDIWYLLRAFKNFRPQLFHGLKYRFINKVDGISGNQIALKYVINNPHIACAVFGTTSMDHLNENIAALNKDIPEDILAKVKKIKPMTKDIR